MPSVNPELWKEAGPYLDRALELSAEERMAWLESVRAAHPDLAGFIEDLLTEHGEAAAERFLERSPISSGEAAAEGRKGQSVGPYTLISPIGQGGMGSVWLAERSDGRFERRVAVKFLRVSVESQGGAERFRREGMILGLLAHPCIAELIDAGVTGKGELYLVLENVEGEHIDEYCDNRRLPIDARVRLFLDVVSAVAHAHARLIVHRDIKPSNVLVRDDGQVKLLDFGIAKLLANDTEAGVAFLTLGGANAFTPQFAAPEQLSGAPVTTATDVYALGVLFYLLLTGTHPAGTRIESAAALVKAIIESEPRRASDVAWEGGTGVAENRKTTPEKLHRALLGDLDTIIAKALKKAPEERYGTVTALGDDLQHYLKHEPIAARPDTLAYRTAKFVRRNRARVAMASVALFAIIGGAAGTLIQARAARQQRDFALHQLARTERINELNQFLLSDASASDQPFTVPQLLDRARQIVQSEDDSIDPANHVNMLISIGTGDPDLPRASPLLEEAYHLSRGLHDPSIRARAACALAVALFGVENHARAESLYQEGIRELPNEPEYALDRVFCLLRGGEVATYAGRTLDESVARAQAAQQVLNSSGLSSSYLNLRVLETLGDFYVESHLPQAIATDQQAVALEKRLGYDGTMTASETLSSLGVALMRAGRPAEAEQCFRRALEILGSREVPWNLQAYAEALRQLGRVKEAAGYASRGYSAALKRGDDKDGELLCLLELLRIYADERKFSDAESAFSGAEKLARSILPPGYYLFAIIASDRAQLSRAEGRLAAALSAADQSIILDEADIHSGRGGSPWLPWFLYRRAGIEVESSQPEKAIHDAQRAISLLQSTVGANEFSMHIGLAYLYMGQAFHLKGNESEAKADFRSAAEQLEKTLGRDNTSSRMARQLASLNAH